MFFCNIPDTCYFKTFNSLELNYDLTFAFNYQFAIHSPLLDGQNLCNRHKNSFFNHISLGFSARTILPVKNTTAICRGPKGKLKCMRILSCLKSLESSMLIKKKKTPYDGWCSQKFLQKLLTFPLWICCVCLVLVFFYRLLFRVALCFFSALIFFFSLLFWNDSLL